MKGADGSDDLSAPFVMFGGVSDAEFGGVFGGDVSVVVFDGADVLFDVGCGVEYGVVAYSFFFVVDEGEYDGYLCFLCDVVEASFPFGVVASRAFGGECYDELVAVVVFLCYSVGHACFPASLDGYSSEFSHDAAEWESEPFFFHEE